MKTLWFVVGLAVVLYLIASSLLGCSSSQDSTCDDVAYGVWHIDYVETDGSCAGTTISSDVVIGPNTPNPCNIQAVNEAPDHCSGSVHQFCPENYGTGEEELQLDFSHNGLSYTGKATLTAYNKNNGILCVGNYSITATHTHY